MRIKLYLKKWPEDSILVHSETEYEIYRDVLLQNRIYHEIGNETNNKLNFNDTELVVPEGSVYYARMRRKFENGEVGDWSKVKELHAKTNLITMKERPHIVIEEPMIKYEVDSARNIIKFMTGKMKMSSGRTTHEYSHWYITDSMGVKIFSSLYDGSNKTSLEVDKSLITPDNQYKVCCAHVGANSIEGVFNSMKFILS